MTKKEKQPIALPPEAQQLLMQLQVFKQQLQAIAMQKEGMHIQKLENSKALEELEKTKDSEEVFKVVGPVLIKSTKKDMEEELTDRNKTIDSRLKTFEKQEKSTTEKAMEIQNKLQEMLSGAGPKTQSEAAG